MVTSREQDSRKTPVKQGPEKTPPEPNKIGACTAYDFHGNWEPHHAGPNAPLYAPTTDHEGSAHQAVLYLIGRGIPKSKLHLGMPFYGREFNASQLYGPASGGTDLEYSVVALRTSSIAWDYFWDDVSKVPYLLNTSRTKFVTFDDSLSITMKCQYAKNEGLGGVMIWALGQDLVAGEQRLMEAVGIAMGTATGVHEPEPPKTIVKTFELFQNYPNPFNPTTTISFFLQRDMNIKLSIYDITGRHVTILQEVKASKGMNAVTWDASDQASGPYFYRLEGADGLIEVRKMILLR